MSALEIFPATWFERWILGQELRHDSDTPAPPSGYASWADYYRIYIRGELPVTTFASPAGVPRGRKVSLTWTRDAEDVATIGLHFLHRDGSDVTAFTEADSVLLEGALDDLWDSISGQYTADIQLDRYTWHEWGVDVRRPNPFVRQLLKSPAVAGTHIGDDPIPPQCATSVTLKTSARKNWGRVYLPATVESNVTAGRFIATWTERVRDAFGALVDFGMAHELPLVIWCPRHDGQLLQFFPRDADHPESAHSLSLDLPDSSSFARTVDQVQVDDIVDTIRSRRFDRALRRDTHTAGA